tara:strand:+ start:295 stop:1044 length:750 start_codon:yes stop_codon:yes gene_type:complete
MSESPEKIKLELRKKEEEKSELRKKEAELLDTKNKRGIFGFGLSTNINLDILNIIILAFAGIVIKIFFQENFSQDGTIGPASTTIWGYGLTFIAIIILLFISFYLIRINNCGLSPSEECKELHEKKGLFESTIGSFDYIKLVFKTVLPIFLTLFIIFYIILLNFTYFHRINSNRVSDSYHSYSFISTVLIIIQLILIVKYIYKDLYKKTEDKEDKESIFAKNATYILSAINFVFIVILHILLAFFSTDG